MIETSSMDKVVNSAIVNLYTKSKVNKTIEFINFDKNNEAHLALFEIAKLSHSLFNVTIKIDLPFLKFFWFWRKSGAKTFLFRNKYPNESMIDCDDFINFIEKAYNLPGAFQQIYLIYYKREK